MTMALMDIYGWKLCQHMAFIFIIVLNSTNGVPSALIY